MEPLGRFDLNGPHARSHEHVDPRTAPMTNGNAGILTLVAAVGAGLVGGVFFAFSAFVMRALRGLPDEQGLAAMQAVNRAAPAPRS